MTPRSAAERGPRTAAGRDALVRLEAAEAAFLTGGMEHAAAICVDLQDAILAIEAETGATAAVPTAADAWQAGYEACWNRLRDAGRLLPAEGAAVPLDADMERPETLALLFLIADCVVQMAEKASPDAGRRRAQLTRAAEMMDARLSADEEGGT